MVVCQHGSMHARQRSLVVWAALAAVLIVAACSSDSARCVSNHVGEVCANPNDGAVNFRGDGLLPGSEVVVGETVVGPLKYTVGDDGSFDPGSSSGVMAVFADTEFTFDVTATDADGNALTGQIEIPAG